MHIYRCEKEELAAVEEHQQMSYNGNVHDEYTKRNNIGILLNREKWHFRSIQRPDVDITSPPMRAGNPVILDSRFHDMDAIPLNSVHTRSPRHALEVRPLPQIPLGMYTYRTDNMIRPANPVSVGRGEVCSENFRLSTSC